MRETIKEVSSNAYLVFVPFDDLQNLQKESELLNRVHIELERLKDMSFVDSRAKAFIKNLLDKINDRS